MQKTTLEKVFSLYHKDVLLSDSKYNGVFSLFLRHFKHNDLTKESISLFLESLRLSPSTLKSKVAYAKAAFNYAIKKGITDKNPFAETLPWEVRKKMRVEFKTVYASIESKRSNPSKFITCVEYAEKTLSKKKGR